MTSYRHRLTVRANRLDSARFEAAAKYGSAILDGLGADTWVDHWANRYHRLNVLVRRLDERIANADDRPSQPVPIFDPHTGDDLTDVGTEVECDECGREYYEPQPTYGGLPNTCPDCYRHCSHSPAQGWNDRELS